MFKEYTGVDFDTIETVASLAVNGGRVVAAWPSGQTTELATSIAFRGWAPTPQASLAGAGATATATGGYTNVSARPGLFAAPDGLHVVTGGVIAGQSRTYLTPPLPEGQNGGAATEIAQELTGAIDAVALAGGGFEVANMTNGEVRVYRDSAPDPAKTPILQNLLGGRPRATTRPSAQDAARRLWVAWYSNASGNIGIYLLQLDPATGGPLAGAQPTKVPQSESPANNGFHLALACARRPAGSSTARRTRRRRRCGWRRGRPARAGRPTSAAARGSASGCR